MKRAPAAALALLASACAGSGPRALLDASARDAGTADGGLAAEDAASGPDAGAGAGADAAAPLDAGDPADAASPDLGVLDAGARDPLAGAPAAALVRGRFSFLEGPVWDAAAGVLLFSDLGTNTIFALAPPATVTPFRNPSGSANGLAFDPQRRLLAAEHGSRSLTRTLASGRIETVAASFEGHRLNSPNDVAVRRSDGTVYFTDPPWGLNNRPRELDFNGVFRVAPDGTLSAERRYPAAVNPNGAALAPDERTLYVALDTEARVAAFDVGPDGALSGERTFAQTAATPDGMAVDADGNVYVATSAGVEVYAPDGTRWGALAVPEQPSNCAFGGAARTTLYVTARTGLYRVELAIPGGE